MNTDEPQSTLLYVSRIAAHTTAATVANLANAARIRNASDGITGLLAFDGLNFAQLAQGPTLVVDALLERLRKDVRHIDMRVLAVETLSTAPVFPDWRLGFIELPARESLNELRRVRGTEAINMFVRSLPPLERELDTVTPKSVDGNRPQ